MAEIAIHYEGEIFFLKEEGDIAKECSVFISFLSNILGITLRKIFKGQIYDSR